MLTFLSSNHTVSHVADHITLYSRSRPQTVNDGPLFIKNERNWSVDSISMMHGKVRPAMIWAATLPPNSLSSFSLSDNATCKSHCWSWSKACRHVYCIHGHAGNSCICTELVLVQYIHTVHSVRYGVLRKRPHVGWMTGPPCVEIKESFVEFHPVRLLGFFNIEYRDQR